MHKVEFRLRGYKPRWETLYVEPGSRRFIELNLFPEDGSPTGPAPAVGSTSETPSDETPDAGAPIKVPTPPAPIADTGKPKTNVGPDTPRPKTGKAYLTVTAPIKLKVSVGGRFVGETPVQRMPLDAGVHRLKAESAAEGFVLRRKVRLTSGRTETVDLRPRKGKLAVNASPWAWVRVGKSSPKETPVRLDVYEGEYVVMFECPDGRRKREQARVSPSQTASVSVNCRN